MESSDTHQNIFSNACHLSNHSNLKAQSLGNYDAQNALLNPDSILCKDIFVRQVGDHRYVQRFCMTTPSLEQIMKVVKKKNHGSLL